jgi:flagellar motor component MotA
MLRTESQFARDCLRLIVGGNLDPHELESLLEYELETHHQEAQQPAHAVQRVADALPGFGIVAADHGGAWKVAYADFVTAMMAFLMVMWLIAAVSKEQRAAIFDYFKNPSMQQASRRVP